MRLNYKLIKNYVDKGRYQQKQKDLIHVKKKGKERLLDKMFKTNGKGIKILSMNRLYYKNVSMFV